VISVYTVVVPAFNEGRRLGNTLKQLRHLGFDARIVVVADGCCDNTVEVARANHVDVVECDRRLGKGGAIAYALEYVGSENVVFVDADLPVDLASINRVVSYLDSYDLVLASRLTKDSNIIKKSPLHRVILGKIFNVFLHRLFHLSVADTQCGLKAFRKSTLQTVFRNMNVHGWLFDVELILKAQAEGLRIKEVGVNWTYKNHGKLRVLRQSWEMLLGLLTLKLESFKQNRTFNYSTVKGDAYADASHSWFLPRRIWHNHKNNMVLKGINGQWILDVGCGSGEMLRRLHNCSVFGVDVGEGFVDYCKTHYPFAHVFKQDAHNLEFPDGMFDDVVCSEVLEHLANPDKAVSEFARVLKANGKLILTTPHHCLRWLVLEWFWTRVRRERLEGNHGSFSIPRLRQLLTRHGFRVFVCKPFMWGCLVYAVATKSA
jgi:glycosyltransferase involved in cell wall biosynthesis